MSYKTILSPAVVEFTEKRSRFIGAIYPASNIKEATGIIDNIKSKHYDARHNCSAFSLRQDGYKKYSDDGEPQGTGGMPILDVLNKAEITDALIVVTRYFGGILLGAGGLIRAYSNAASMALCAAEPVIMLPHIKFTVNCDYSDYNLIKKLIFDYDGTLNNNEYTDKIIITATISKVQYEDFVLRLKELTAGRIEPYIIENLFHPVKKLK